MKIGVLGTGTIATAVVRGIARDGHQITVSHRSRANAEALAAEFANVQIASNADVVAGSDLIFLGLMAETAGDILDGLPFRADQQVISFMAGADLPRVAQLVAPATASAVLMPFPGIADGGSPVMALGDAALVQEVFGRSNRVFMLKSEAELGAYLAAQAVLSPAVSLVGAAATWLGARVQDPDQGEAFLRLLVGSSLMGQGCAPLLEALNTPGGYNQRLRLHMENSDMNVALKDWLDAQQP